MDVNNKKMIGGTMTIGIIGQARLAEPSPGGLPPLDAELQLHTHEAPGRFPRRQRKRARPLYTLKI
jgi:hypothetical protein